MVLLIAAVMGGLIAREVLLFWAASQLRSSLSTLRKMHFQQTYFNDCRQKGTLYIEGEEFALLQLRFLSSRKYQVEVLCSQFSLDPVVVDTQELPPLVRKTPGSAGIVFGEAPSAVQLELFGRTTRVGVENLQSRWFSNDESLGLDPVSSCQGYGFSCCDVLAQQGVGNVLPQAADCPKSCFARCSSRPLLLSFTTQPFADPKTRTVQIIAGQSVSFNYVSEPGEASSVQVSLDYGDGQIETFTTPFGMASHTYRCQASQCQYTARIIIQDDRGVTSAQTTVSELSIVATQ